MSNFDRMARHGAAHAWGVRHYRWYAAAAYGRRFGAAAVTALAAAGAVALGAWLLHRVPLAVVLLGLAGAAMLAAWLRVVYLVSARRSGGSPGLAALAVLALALIVAAAAAR